jgi:hypothetical protein
LYMTGLGWIGWGFHHIGTGLRRPGVSPSSTRCWHTSWPDSLRSILSGAILCACQVSEAVSQLRLYAYRCAAPRLVRASSIIREVEGQRWDMNELQGDASAYTDTITATCRYHLWHIYIYTYIHVYSSYFYTSN